MNARQLTAAWFEKTARQTKQLMQVRYWQVSEDRTGLGSRWSLDVMGVPFDDQGKAIRSKLKSLGFWWSKKQGLWLIDSGSPSLYNIDKNPKHGKHRKNQERAFPIVQAMAKEYNEKVVKPHNDALKRMAPGAPTDFRSILKSIDSDKRSKRWLQSAGIEMTVSRPGNRWEFFESFVEFSGNTYPIKDTLKAFGFKFSGGSKSWRVPYVEWTVIKAKFFAAAAKEINAQVRQPAAPKQGIFETMSKQQLGAFILRFFKKTRNGHNPFDEWFMPTDEADEGWTSELDQVRAVSKFLKAQDVGTQAKMHDAMADGNGDALYRLMGNAGYRYASAAGSRLIGAWYMGRKTAFSTPEDMVDAVSNYFRKTRMNAKAMLRNFSKDPESVIKMLELALKQTGWAKMWWPKRPQDWLDFLKSVAQ